MHAGVAEFVVKMHGFCGFQNLAFRYVDEAVMTQIFTGFVDPACFAEIRRVKPTFPLVSLWTLRCLPDPNKDTTTHSTIV